MLVTGQCEEGIPPIHEVTAEQGVGVDDGGQRVDDGPSVEVDHKEDLGVREEPRQPREGKDRARLPPSLGLSAAVSSTWCCLAGAPRLVPSHPSLLAPTSLCFSMVA